MKNINIAVIQLNTSQNIKRNLEQFQYYLEEAVTAGANFITTPEVVNFITGDHRFRIENAVQGSNNEFIKVARKICQNHRVWILIGSLVCQCQNSQKCLNRSFLISPQGKIVSTYDKIHMFDVNLGNGHIFKESDFYERGHRAVMAKTDFSLLGQTICYDLRFPLLYKNLAEKGAQIITVPSAFTRITGEKHWEVLLRARAIECGVFIVAPAQCGVHGNMDRESFGHSCIISPTGEVLAMMDESPGYAMATVDLKLVKEARDSIPSLQNSVRFV